MSKSKITSLESFALSGMLVNQLEKWNSNKERPISGYLGSRALGLICTPLTSTLDFLAHLVLFIGKTLTGAIATPWNSLAGRISKKLEMPANLELTSALVHLSHSINSLVRTILLPLITVIDPSAAYKILHKTTNIKPEIRAENGSNPQVIFHNEHAHSITVNFGNGSVNVLSSVQNNVEDNEDDSSSSEDSPSFEIPPPPPEPPRAPPPPALEPQEPLKIIKVKQSAEQPKVEQSNDSGGLINELTARLKRQNPESTEDGLDTESFEDKLTVKLKAQKAEKVQRALFPGLEKNVLKSVSRESEKRVEKIGAVANEEWREAATPAPSQTMAATKSKNRQEKTKALKDALTRKRQSEFKPIVNQRIDQHLKGLKGFVEFDKLASLFVSIDSKQNPKGENCYLDGFKEALEEAKNEIEGFLENINDKEIDQDIQDKFQLLLDYEIWIVTIKDLFY